MSGADAQYVVTTVTPGTRVGIGGVRITWPPPHGTCPGGGSTDGTAVEVAGAWSLESESARASLVAITPSEAAVRAEAATITRRLTPPSIRHPQRATVARIDDVDIRASVQERCNPGSPARQPELRGVVGR